MKIKSKLSVLAVFSCCALASIGFASWVITHEGTASDLTSGGISADSVIVSNDYVYIADKEEDISMFTYSESGFVHDGYVDYEGIMSVKFTVNLDNCSNLITNSSDSISVAINLRLNENGKTVQNNLIPTLFNQYITVTCTEYEESLIVESTNKTVDSSSYVLTTTLALQIAENSGEATFVLEYKFKFTDVGTYTTFLYNIFYNSTTQDETGVEFAFDLLIGN